MTCGAVQKPPLAVACFRALGGTCAPAISLYADGNMQPNRLIRAMELIAVGSLLSACSWDLPGSFKVGSVEVLDTVEVGELLPWYVPPAADSKAVGLLRIEVTSPVDLVSFANEHSFSVSYVAYYCGNEGGARRTVYSAVYPMVGGRKISGGSSVSPTDMANSRGTDGQIRYAFFVPLDERPFRDVYGQLAKKSNIAAPLYDYKANPEDLCFQIRGGDMVGRTYASAPIPIKHGEILDAVAHRKLQ
jgi:hypothetical protein